MATLEIRSGPGRGQAFRVTTPLSFRMGLHHGPALVGEFGPAVHSGYAAAGREVAVAQRIAGHASGGDIFGV
jgi:class 3 adenylate cyclase